MKYAVLSFEKNSPFLGHLETFLDEKLTILNPIDDSVPKDADIIINRVLGVYWNDELYQKLKSLDQNQNLKVINSIEHSFFLSSKIRQKLFLQSLGLNTLNYTLRTGEEWKQSNLDLKMVLKWEKGLKGKYVWFMPEEKEEFLKAVEPKELYFNEKRIEKFSEYRIFVARNEIIFVAKKRIENLRGNSTSLEMIDPIYFSSITNQIKKIPVTYFAMDVLEVESDIYIMELNLCPGMELVPIPLRSKVLQRILYDKS